MKLRNLLPCAAFAAAALLSGCSGTGASSPYTVTVPLTEDKNHLMAYIVDFDSGEKIDSTVVDANEAVFKGSLDKPVLARVIVEGSRLGTFVLEPGEITLRPDVKEASGSPLNVRFNMIADSLHKIEREYEQLPRDTAFEARAMQLNEAYNGVVGRAVAANADNPIGLYYFLQTVYSLQTVQQLDSALAVYPAFGGSKRVQSLKTVFKAKESTSAGKKFKDFTIRYKNEAGADSVARLSDYAGRGKWLLVDFWASWCGPCIRETKVLKEILADYAPLGLEVLGVAVCDEPENTVEAIKQHGLPWPQIIGGQTVPTDLYGISGIPCIILIDPQGNIVARDLQGEELKAAVRKALVDDAEASSPQR